MESYPLDGRSLTIPSLVKIASGKARVRLPARAARQIERSRQLVKRWVERGETVYGVTTGFGELANVRVPRSKLGQLQVNLILSHAAGSGEPLPPEVVRAMMTLRANALAKGYSGVQRSTVELLVAMLNHNIVPVIPSQGSVGASGDLVQLAHLVLGMMARGKVFVPAGSGGFSPRTRPAASALRQAGLRPVRLSAKEGLALINGTQMMTAYAALTVAAARSLARLADIAASVSVEALRGSDTPYDARIHALRPYRGQQTVARNLRRLMRGSELREAHRYDDSRVQDAYSMRCIPQVHGASRDAIDYVYDVILVELNSANDNPLIFPKEGVHLEGGNFHGQPIALACDFLAIALAELASISERRIERLVNGSLSGLPRFLTDDGGLNSGLMIAQYTAASLVSENKVLCHPGSVDSIPTSANQEDHNSMGSVSAQKALRVLKNAQTVLAIELLCACQGLEFAKAQGGHNSLHAGTGSESAYRCVRRSIPRLERDRVLHADIQAALKLVESDDVIKAVERETGPLD